MKTEPCKLGINEKKGENIDTAKEGNVEERPHAGCEINSGKGAVKKQERPPGKGRSLHCRRL